jgi:hypothetical protein
MTTTTKPRLPMASQRGMTFGVAFTTTERTLADGLRGPLAVAI